MAHVETMELSGSENDGDYSEDESIENVEETPENRPSGNAISKKNMAHVESMELSGSENDGDYSEDESIENKEENPENMMWANAMSNILKTVPKKEKVILSKAKKDDDIKPKKAEGIQLVDDSGKTIKIKTKTEKSGIERKKSPHENQRKKAEWEAMCRVKPDIIKKEKEKELIKIATRGVVHLFNTVKQHQKTVKTARKPGKNEKPSAVKGAFMDILKKHSKQGDQLEADPVVQKVKQEETWSILKDDFMMGADMKDWDKGSEEET